MRLDELPWETLTSSVRIAKIGNSAIYHFVDRDLYTLQPDRLYRSSRALVTALEAQCWLFELLSKVT